MLKRFFRKLPLTKKLMVYYLPLSIIPLLFVTLIMSNTFEKLITQRTLSSASDNSTLIISQIESLFDSTENCGNLLTININNIYDKMPENPSAANNLSIYNAISNELSFTLLTYPNIDSAAFYSIDQQLYTSTRKLSDPEFIFYQSNLYESLKITTGQNHWFSLMRRNYLTQNQEDALISMGKKVINISDGSTLGYLMININESSIHELLSLQQYNYWIIDDKDSLISTNGEDPILQHVNTDVFDNYLLKNSNYSGVRRINNDKYVTTMFPFTHIPWRVISQLPYDTLTADLKELSLFLFIVIIVVLALAIFSSWFLGTLIARPIRSLNQGMYKVSHGDFDLRLTAETNDEIGSMAVSFNNMSGKVGELLQTIKKEQQAKREYELALIQEQIKPHFLYNCLDLIYTLNLMGRQKDAAKATKSLADYYRVSLSKGAGIITLVDEIKSVEDYLTLQQIRYIDVFDYKIEFPSELGQYKILKLTLQPLVENAIYHGLKTKETFGHLLIQVTMENEILTISVKDDGLGMDDEVISNLLKPTKERKHYGLYNVQHRIQLFYGEEYGLFIHSKLHEGTSVNVVIPAILDELKLRTHWL